VPQIDSDICFFAAVAAVGSSLLLLAYLHVMQVMRVIDSETVFLNPPHDSKAYKNSTKAPTTYAFSKVFDERTSQENFFNDTTRPMVKVRPMYFV